MRHFNLRVAGGFEPCLFKFYYWYRNIPEGSSQMVIIVWLGANIYAQLKEAKKFWLLHAQL